VAVVVVVPDRNVGRNPSSSSTGWRLTKPARRPGHRKDASIREPPPVATVVADKLRTSNVTEWSCSVRLISWVFGTVFSSSLPDKVNQVVCTLVYGSIE
jgi:hypothetical protein